jgi:hypothetical protein
LYNGNIEDPIIKRSVQKRTDDEKDGAPDGSFFVLPGNHSDAGSIRTVRDPIPFNKSHLRSAKEKMNLASEKYDEFTSDALRRFDDKEIYPEVLQDLLFRVFMVKFSLPECAAIVSDVDKDNSGSLDYAEFLTSFFHLAFNHKQELALEQVRGSEGTELPDAVLCNTLTPLPSPKSSLRSFFRSSFRSLQDYSAHKARDKVRPSEERSDELTTPSLETKTTRTRTFIRDAPPP